MNISSSRWAYRIRARNQSSIKARTSTGNKVAICKGGGTVKKKPMTETKTVSDQVTSDEVRVKGTNREDEE